MNPFEMIKNLKNMQSNMKEMQEKMALTTVVGTSGGDMVRVTMNGQMEVTDVFFSPEVVDPSDISMLQDLVKAAHADAMVKIKDILKDSMLDAGGGAMPPGFMDM